MKRAVGALVATIAGVAFLAGYKATPADAPPTAATSEAASPSPIPTSRVAPSRTPTPTTTAAPVAAGPNGSQIVTGSMVDTIFGEVQVKVTVSGKRIIDVQAVALPYDRSRSAYISQVAGPMLRSEAIQAQGANIDIISGATYTSIAYGRSLAAALQQAQSN